MAVALDGATLLMAGAGEGGFRLFGVLPHAGDGASAHLARGALDDLLIGHVVRCSELDEARYGSGVARCGTAATPDLAIALLRQGWVLADGPALQNSALAHAYLAAEREARQSGAGLWEQSSASGGVAASAWTVIVIALAASAIGWWMVRSIRSAVLDAILALAAATERRHERERAVTAVAFKKVLLADLNILGQECARLCNAATRLAEGRSHVRAVDLQQLIPPQPAVRPSMADLRALLDADMAPKLVRFYDELSLTGQQLRRWGGAAPHDIVPVSDVKEIQNHWQRVCEAARDSLYALSDSAYALELASREVEQASPESLEQGCAVRLPGSMPGRHAA